MTVIDGCNFFDNFFCIPPSYLLMKEEKHILKTNKLIIYKF